VPSPSPQWLRWRTILADEDLPAAVVDLDALDHNIDHIVGALDDSTCTLRPATKSIRCTHLLRYIQDRGGPRLSGLMAFTADEAVQLAADGFQDLLVAYPSVRPSPLRRVARAVRDGARIHLIADSVEHVEAYAAAARAERTVLNVVLELDLAYRPLGDMLHLGARRSPLRTVPAALALAATIRATEGVQLHGLMGYEAHVASTREVAPGQQARAPVIRALKQRWMVPALRALREEAVTALRSAGHSLPLVNGGGTGSLRTTSRESTCTEVTAGSGFLCSHLFSGFDGLNLQPALFYAVEVVRRPDPHHVTCLGGGIVASGALAADKLPEPHLPPGLTLTPMEGAGEVQTPLQGPGIAHLQPGDPVLFRPAKAGEPAERFSTYLLVRGHDIVERVPTYRGRGWCFL
jgi:D-serine deaminase-like pyridoxal phosphate-dependent protein